MRPPTHFPETTIQNLPAIIELYDHSKFILSLFSLPFLCTNGAVVCETNAMHRWGGGRVRIVRTFENLNN